MVGKDLGVKGGMDKWGVGSGCGWCGCGGIGSGGWVGIAANNIVWWDGVDGIGIGIGIGIGVGISIGIDGAGVGTDDGAGAGGGDGTCG